MVTDTNDPSSSRRVPEVEAADPQEIRAAIEGLTAGQLLKLERYARFRIRGLGRKARGRDHGDLLREALTATLAGNRRWRRRTVDFFNHLIGVMRSLSSHWEEQFVPLEALNESELIHRETGMSPLDGVRSQDPDPERVLDARQTLRGIERRFATDPTVPFILSGLKQGLTGPEIQSSMGLTKHEYESAVKRMRRGIRAMQGDDTLGRLEDPHA